MRAARFLVLSFLLLATVVATASAMEAAPASAPKGLHGFLLRPDEPATRTFSRTPAFAWAPVRGASCYEFELGTSRTFEGSTIVWSNVPTGTQSGRSCGPVKRAVSTVAAEEGGDVTVTPTPLQITIPAIRIPAVSISLTLPWFTGKPYALYAHVRAVSTNGASRWSRPFGFNMRWEDLPIPLVTKPGLVRWTPVDGATSYEVWYPDIRRTLRTHTNVADQREFYTMHWDPDWWATVRWRVRAVRQVLGAVPNGLPPVSYGPWSSLYTATNPALTPGKLKLKGALSDVVSSDWTDAPHQLMPGLTFAGLDPFGTDYLPLFRVYAATDRDCVNIVFRSSVVGSPAFAPRLTGPLELPDTLEDIELAELGALGAGSTEGAKSYMHDGTPVTSNETVSEEGRRARVDLPDVDAKTTRYFWTVVPVGIEGTEEGQIIYRDLELPQDVCQAGRVATFAKLARPVITGSGGAFVSGLSPSGRLLTSAGRRPVVYSTPLVAWQPVVGASTYEVEWSRTTYPWRRSGRVITRSTSAVLRLSHGLWYYRIRGLNAAQVGTPAMTWSAPVAIKIARPTFKISRG